MRLSEIQRNVVHASEFHGDLTYKQIAVRCRSKEHIVRYHLHRLQQIGIISQPRPFIDLNAAGYMSFTYYFSLASEKRSEKKQILKKLIQNPQVLWLLEIGGDYQYVMLICARHVREVIQLLGRVSVRFGSAFFDKSMSIRYGYTALQRSYLRPSSRQREIFSLGSMSQEVQLSSLEERILSGLANESYRSDKELAKKLDIPLSTFMRHKHSLEEKKVISGYYYRTSAEKFGMLLFKLLIHTKGISARLSQDLSVFAKGLSCSAYFIECMGSWDFELGVEVQQASEVTGVTRDIYDRFGAEISNIRILPVFHFVKLTSYPAQPRAQLDMAKLSAL